jgi:hypothetical protein
VTDSGLFLPIKQPALPSAIHLAERAVAFSFDEMAISQSLHSCWSGWRFHQQQHHDHRRLRLDTVTLAGGHVDPGASLRLVLVVAQRHRGLPLDELQDGGHRGRVFGQFLALSKTEDHRLDLFIVEQRAAEDAFVGRLASFARSLMCMYDVIVEGRNRRPAYRFRLKPKDLRRAVCRTVKRA